MSNPIIKVARANYDLTDATPENLAFSSEWESPKICVQTDSNWDNTLGYIPAFLSFRKLNSTDYCHETFDNAGDIDNDRGAYFNSSGDLTINTRSGDSGMTVIIFLDQISGTVSGTITPKDNLPKIVLAKENYSISDHPVYHSVNSQYDSMKIYKTGTLELSMNAETIPAGAANRIYTSEYEHGLGYPPVYFPVVGKDWHLRYSALSNDSFIVNDYVGYLAAMPSFLESDLSI